MSKFISRKLAVAVMTALVVALNNVFALGLSEEAQALLVGLAITYLISQGWVDAKQTDDGK